MQQNLFIITSLRKRMQVRVMNQDLLVSMKEI